MDYHSPSISRYLPSLTIHWPPFTIPRCSMYGTCTYMWVTLFWGSASWSGNGREAERTGRIPSILHAVVRSFRRSSRPWTHENEGNDIACNQRAYQLERWLPKMHVALHLSTMYSHHLFLLRCWVHDRNHCEIEQYAPQNSKTSTGFEKSVLVDALALRWDDLNVSSTGPFTVGLVDPQEPSAPGPVFSRVL